jgi:hypothetical protein
MRSYSSTDGHKIYFGAEATVEKSEVNEKRSGSAIFKTRDDCSCVILKIFYEQNKSERRMEAENAILRRQRLLILVAFVHHAFKFSRFLPPVVARLDFERFAG